VVDEEGSTACVGTERGAAYSKRQTLESIVMHERLRGGDFTGALACQAPVGSIVEMSLSIGG